MFCNDNHGITIVGWKSNFKKAQHAQKLLFYRNRSEALGFSPVTSGDGTVKKSEVDTRTMRQAQMHQVEGTAIPGESPLSYTNVQIRTSLS